MSEEDSSQTAGSKIRPTGDRCPRVPSLPKNARFPAWAILILLLALRPLHAGAPGDSETVATIDGEPVQAAELRHWMLLTRAEVYRYFHRTHGVRDAHEFWHRPHGGECPAATLRETALRKIVHYKAPFLLAKHKGLLLAVPDHASLLAAMERENRRREGRVAKGEVVFGSSRFTPQTYPAQVHDQVAEDLRARLSRGDFQAGAAATRAPGGNLPPPEPRGDAPSRRIGPMSMEQADETYRALIKETAASAVVMIDQEKFHQVKAW